VSHATFVNAACPIARIGPSGSPIVLVLGGISSSRHVTSTTANPARGWWSDVVGPGLTIDTTKLEVVSADYVVETDDQSDISTHGQARALIAALDDAGIDRVDTVVGASYGGMVALALASLEPERVRSLVIIGAAHESSASATAHRVLQRKVVELGIHAGASDSALVIARGMAVATYSTPDYLRQRFDSPIAAERLQAIDAFLSAEGKSFAVNCSPPRFLSLSRSLDLHCVDPCAITCPTTLIAVKQDSLVPLTQVRDLAARIGGPCTVEVIDSASGHDAFLTDPGLIAPIIERALQAMYGGPL
jgi:homoserine O-acetyltransferase